MQFQKCFLKKNKQTCLESSDLDVWFGFFNQDEAACFILGFVYGAMGGRKIK